MEVKFYIRFSGDNLYLALILAEQVCLVYNYGLIDIISLSNDKLPAKMFGEAVSCLQPYGDKAMKNQTEQGAAEGMQHKILLEWRWDTWFARLVSANLWLILAGRRIRGRKTRRKRRGEAGRKSAEPTKFYRNIFLYFCGEFFAQNRDRPPDSRKREPGGLPGAEITAKTVRKLG